jgi:hypothetical protein
MWTAVCLPGAGCREKANGHSSRYSPLNYILAVF